MTFFLNSNIENIQLFTNDDYLNQSGNTKDFIMDSTNNQIIIEREFYFSKGFKSNRYNSGVGGFIDVNENQQAIVRAFSLAWRYKEMYEEFGSVDYIINSEHMGKRTVYKYLNLAYISPKILNDVMSGKKSINVQDLFALSSKYHNFNEQEASC